MKIVTHDSGRIMLGFNRPRSAFHNPDGPEPRDLSGSDPPDRLHRVLVRRAGSSGFELISVGNGAALGAPDGRMQDAATSAT